MKALKQLLFIFFAVTACYAQKNEDLTNLSYGKNKQQTLDLFLPKAFDTKTPVLIMLHGGAWSMGGKEYTDKTAKDLRDLGFIVANVDYRYVDANTHAADLLKDIDNAVAYLEKTGKDKGFSTKAINLAGISAGAHLALLYSYTTSRNVKSVSALCAPSKFNDSETFAHIQKLGLVKVLSQLADAEYTATSSNTAKFAAISPFVKAISIPTLLVHGTNDDLVDYQQSVNLYNYLQTKKIKSKLVTMEGKGHDVGMNQPESEKKVLEEITNWIKTNQ